MGTYLPRVGETVRAFHPHMFGVIKHGTILQVGRKYARVDFGIHGIARVPLDHIVDAGA